jgi:hypothetical protein
MLQLFRLISNIYITMVREDKQQSRVKVLETKINETIEIITALKEDNKNLRNINMKLVSELDLLRGDATDVYKVKADYELITARDKKIKEKILDLKHRLDRLNI